MTPALLKRTSRRGSAARNWEAEALMVERSERSRGRWMRVPVDVGCAACRAEIVEAALDAERAAR